MRIEPFTRVQYDQLRANAAKQLANQFKPVDEDLDFEPVVKVFTPDGQCIWLLTEMDEDGRCFGLADLGQGVPELGYVWLEELQAARGHIGLKVEVDIAFKATKTLNEYAKDAIVAGRIVT